MRHRTLVEQMAAYDHGTQTFAPGDAIPGRRTWDQAGADEDGGGCYYRAATLDEAQWEFGIGTVGVGGLVRVQTLLSSTGSAVNFSAAVKVSLVAPAAALWAINSAAPELSALASGVDSMAAGRLAQATGVDSIGIGRGASASGDSGTALGALSIAAANATAMGRGASGQQPYSMALGRDALAGHRSATALGAGASTIFESAVHHRYGFWWTGSAYTFGTANAFAEDVYGGVTSLLLMPAMSSVVLSALVVGQNIGQSKIYAAEVKGVVSREFGLAVLRGSPIVQEIFKTPGAGVSATIAVDGVDAGFGVRVTGDAGEDWNWRVDLRGSLIQ